jgi:hypothetical protein
MDFRCAVNRAQGLLYAFSQDGVHITCEMKLIRPYSAAFSGLCDVVFLKAVFFWIIQDVGDKLVGREEEE